MNNLALGEQIKKLRTAKKMTLAVMSERIGVTISTVAAYENSTRSPSLDVLMKIARLFNVTTDFLLGIGSKDVIDVGGLTIEQRNIIEEIVYTFKDYNTVVMSNYEYLDKNQFTIKDD